MAWQIPSLPLAARCFLRLRVLADRRAGAREQRAAGAPRPQHLLTGERGEDLAWLHLRQRGYTVVARRWHSARLKGDLDLVAWDGDTLVIFEVKTRTAHDLAPAEAAVDHAKRRQLRRLAWAYHGQLPALWRDVVPLRFDLLSVYDLPGELEFDHTPNAFPAMSPR